MAARSSLPEETLVLPDDDEVLRDEWTDEIAAYFDRKISPKILITSFTRASQVGEGISLYPIITNFSLYPFFRCILSPHIENQLVDERARYVLTQL